MVQRAVSPAESRCPHRVGEYAARCWYQAGCRRLCSWPYSSATNTIQAKPKNRIHHDPEKISHHVHRIGHHFPVEIIDLACSKFGYRFTDKTGLQKVAENRTTYGEDYFERGLADYRMRQALHGRPIIAGYESKDLISGAVREMFPKIPEADLSSIVNHAFEKVSTVQTGAPFWALELT